MKTIHHVFDLDAPAATVWAALTQPGTMEGWWTTEVRSEPPAVGVQVHWIFDAEFSPVMEITGLDPGRDLRWRCVSGHQPWQDSDFRFELAELGDRRTRVRFWHEYAVELEDDYYGIYNYNWGYYLESLRLFCTTGTGQPFSPAA
jgi:uncharacterized protein YndB with AHSA1/START domain